jgi:hypothetical protein
MSVHKYDKFLILYFNNSVRLKICKSMHLIKVNFRLLLLNLNLFFVSTSKCFFVVAEYELLNWLSWGSDPATSADSSGTRRR